MNFELRHLQAFVVVAEELHFARAAARLHMAQPALSRQIARLEAGLGVALLVRERRRTTLSPAGHAFLPEARSALHHAQAAQDLARRANRGEQGLLRLGLAPATNADAFLHTTAAFLAAHPDIELIVEERPMPELVPALFRGVVDAAFLAPLHMPTDTGDAVLTMLADDPFVAAVHVRHPVAEQDRIALSAIADEPMIFFHRHLGEEWYAALHDLCRTAGFVPRVRQHVGELQTQLALVAAGLGAALVPASTAAFRRSDIAYLPLLDPTPRVHSVIAWRPTALTEVGKRFQEAITQATQAAAVAAPSSAF